jgi:hypothetical protein
VAKLERQGSNPRVETLAAALSAAGHRLELHAVPRPPSVDEGLIASYLRLAPEERLRAWPGRPSSRGATMPELKVEQLLRTLTGHGVDFVVVGGIAAVLLGSARDTFDLDICPAFDESNLDSLGKALVELEAQARRVEGTRVERRSVEGIVKTAAGGLDILVRPNGSPPHEQLRPRAERKVASIEDLIAMKEASGRRKDLVVVEELEAIKRLRRRLGIRD